MENKKNHIAEWLNVSWSGSDGPNGTPTTLVESDLIAQNLLILAYERPVTMCELADMIGVPTVYVEPIVQKLVNGELMVHTDGDRYYTDFVIFKPEDSRSRFDAQLAFVREHFDEFWTVIGSMVEDIRTMPYAATLNERQMQKLERYAVLHTLQKFRIGMTSDDKIKAPKRRDGGAWLAQGYSYPAEYDYNSERECKLASYTVNGGHRTNHTATVLEGASDLWLREFDTFVWDNPHRFSVGAGYRHYFDGMMQLLWCVEKGIDPSEAGVHSALIEAIPDYIDKTGLLVREDGALKVDIPVMERAIYGELLQKIDAAVCRLREVLSEAFGAFLKGQAMRLPAHLTSVPRDKLYMPATAYIEMAVVIEAYERGLHMRGVDYCCPPVVMVYAEK